MFLRDLFNKRFGVEWIVQARARLIVSEKHEAKKFRDVTDAMRERSRRRSRKERSSFCECKMYMRWAFVHNRKHEPNIIIVAASQVNSVYLPILMAYRRQSSKFAISSLSCFCEIAELMIAIENNLDILIELKFVKIKSLLCHCRPDYNQRPFGVSEN